MTTDFDLSTALNSLFYGIEEVATAEDTVDRLMAPDFVQHLNGTVYDRDEFVLNIRDLWASVNGRGKMTVVEEVREGNAIAGRYVFRVGLAGMSNSAYEAHVFARVHGDRISRIVELNRQVS